MIRELGANVRRVAGEGAAGAVMQGASELNARTDSVALAEWVEGAMERLDERLLKGQREEIMAACGRNCAKVNHRAIEAFRKRRAKYPTLDDFLEAESKAPMTGTKLWRDGSAIIQAYRPAEFSYPMRCYCSLVSGLPSGRSMSSTYCQCSRAFVQQMWQEALGQPVSVDLLQSAISGGTECHFCITLQV